MTLVLMEGFDNYSDDADVGLRGGTVSATPIYLPTGGRWGGGGLQLNDSTDEWTIPLASTIDGGNAVIHYAFWAKFNDLPTNANFIELGNSTDSGGKLRVGADGSLSVIEYNSGSTSDGSVAGVFSQLGVWRHIEVESRYHASSGSHRIWIDGVLSLDVSGIDSILSGTPTAIDRVRFICGSSMDFTVDDLVVWDEVGSDFVPVPLGEHRIEALVPDGDGSVQFTPDTGMDNYARVDDAVMHDGDTSYVESTTIGHADLYDLEGMAGTPVTVHAIAVHTRAKKTDTGAVTMRNRIHSGSTTTEGGDKVLTAGYMQYTDYFGLNPDDSSAWEAADITALQSGFEYQA